MPPDSIWIAHQSPQFLDPQAKDISDIHLVHLACFPIQLIPEAAEAPIAFYKARQDYYRNITANFSPEELLVVIRFLGETIWIEPEGIVSTDEK